MKSVYQATVIECVPEKKDSNIFLLKLKLSGEDSFNAGPGQFVILEPLNSCSVMPRPFAVVEIEANVVSLLINVVGENTKAYSQLRDGEVISLSGPHGNVIPIEPKAPYVFVVGGSGAAAVIMLVKRLKIQESWVTVLIGAKDDNQLSGQKFFEEYGAEVLTITEIGDGQNGFVTGPFEEFLRDDGGVSTVIACGPKSMLERVMELSDRFDNECLVMLEEVMACGVGSCKGCAIFGKDGNIKHICEDGPAIDASWIDWEAFMSDLSTEKKRSDFSHEISMKVNLAGLELDYPAMNASGCLGLKALMDGSFDYSKLGALVTKGVTVLPRVGNKMPRICETDSGMLNSIGLENSGSDVFIRDELPVWLSWGKPVFVNISGFSVDEFAELAQILDDTAIAGYEVNISCPNLGSDKVIFGTDPELARKVTQAVRRVTNKIVIVKLTPNVTDIVSIARAAVEGGADAISLINTVQGMSIDPMTRRPKIAMVTAGLSGPAIRPIAVRMVHQLVQADLGVPIIGMGGIVDAESAAEFFMTGANVIASGTGSFSDRQIFTHINDGLEEIIKQYGFTSIKNLVGSVVIN